MKIIGISAFYHDSAASLIVDGRIVAAAQEERFSRVKHDASFPKSAVKYCIEQEQLSPNQIDAIVFYDKPLLKFERLLETYYAFAPRGLVSFITAMPVWLKEKMFLKRLIKRELTELGFTKIPKILFPEHHLSHAASAYYPSNFEEAAILTIDGVGEWATASISFGKGKNIQVLKELKFPHSLGLLYSAFTYFLGFRVNSGEYKLMGLAPYGNINDKQVQEFENIIKESLINIAEDGSIWLNQKYFSYATGLRMLKDRKWQKLFGLKRREPGEKITQDHCNLSLAIQNITEDVVKRMAMEAKKLTKSENLCLAGGVALNCVSNGKLQNEGIFQNIFIQPAAGDAGGSLGAALAVNHIFFGNERVINHETDAMQGSFLGPEFDEHAIRYIINKYGGVSTKYNYEILYKEVAAKLAQGSVIGWMQGRMEFGPRALGARSILGDARNPEMQKRLNLKIKYRESFRPFAPAVLSEDADKYFEMRSDSPYMLLVNPIVKSIRKELPVGYNEHDLKSKLYFQRSDIPAVTHVDYSSRVQTVHKNTNPHFWNLINSFKELTGYSLLINTSFNVRGEPIVCSPEDAYKCFMRTEMDYLVVGDHLFIKSEQPNWNEKDLWQEEFVLD